MRAFARRAKSQKPLSIAWFAVAASWSAITHDFCKPRCSDLVPYPERSLRMVMAHARSAHLEVASDSSVPEVILPIQYFDRLTVRATDVPEKRLMFAVLLDAVLHLQRRHSRGASEAAEWIEGPDDGSPFSFQSICDCLGLQAEQL